MWTRVLALYYSNSPDLSPSHLGYNKLEQNVRMRLLGWDRKIVVKPLSKEQARDLGAELLGELIVFSCAIIITTFEYNRSSRKEKEKERLQNEKLLKLQAQITQLHGDVAKDRDVNLKLTKVVNTFLDRWDGMQKGQKGLETSDGGGDDSIT